MKQLRLLFAMALLLSYAVYGLR